jgi:hypothetical protein
MFDVGDYLPDFIQQNIGKIGIGAGALAVGTGAGLAIGSTLGGGSKSRKKTTKKKKSSKRRLTPLQKRRKKIIARKGRQTPYTARGGRDRSTRRIRYTKNSQPYIILKSGKAKFISKKSARASRRRKGGRY